MESHVQYPRQTASDRSSPASTTATSAIEAGISNLSIEAAAASSRLDHGKGSATTEPTGENAAQVLDEMRNRAGQSSSPYVQSHASSPVKWQLLDDEAVNRAKSENKLIFLNVGFKACHYCRLMSQESFAHPAVSSLLNESFVPIIVDREERSDIDAIYMNYLQAVMGTGGWPLNVFLTPELAPLFGGTFWPAPGSQVNEDHAEEGGLDFGTVLERMDRVWREEEERCRQEASDMLVKLSEFASEGSLGSRRVTGLTGTQALAMNGGGGISSAALGTSMQARPPQANAAESSVPEIPDVAWELELEQIEEARSYMAKTFDKWNGGFGRPLGNRFPQVPKLSFLLRLACLGPDAVALVGEEDIERAKQHAFFTLRRMRDGGLRDHVGGGFFRYSATPDWSSPHFEKMVADNALLLGVYLDAWLLQSVESPKSSTALKTEDEFADIVLELADYLTSPPILTEDGMFATSEAADSYHRRGDEHVREGAYYVWTKKEFDAVVATDADVVADYWTVTEHGNIPEYLDPRDEFMNQNVLRKTTKDMEELSRQHGRTVTDVQTIISSAKKKLLAHRQLQRVRPETDDKVVAAYNGMVISALARTAQALAIIAPDSSRKYLDAAIKAANTIWQKLWDSSKAVLYRTFSKGRRGDVRGLADDYAFLIEGLLDLQEATGDPHWLQRANTLQEAQIRLFHDQSAGGFYTTEEAAPFIILRLKDGMDSTYPSTNAVSAINIFRLGAIQGDHFPHTTLAKDTLKAFQAEMLQYPWLFVGLLACIPAALEGVESKVALISDAKSKEDAQRLAMLPRGAPRAVVKIVKDRNHARWQDAAPSELGFVFPTEDVPPGVYERKELSKI